MKSDKKTVLVTGGAGDVGSVLIGVFLVKTYNVVGVGKFKFRGGTLFRAFFHRRF